MVDYFHLTPDPSPAGTIVIYQIIYWLERGVKREGAPPPLIKLSPSHTEE